MRTELNAHRMHIEFGLSRSHWLLWIRFWSDANWMRIDSIHLRRWIGTESQPNSLFIHRITIKSRTVTPPWTATLLKLSRLGRHTHCIHHPRYKLWWPIMLGHYWLDAVEKETAYQMVLCSSLKFMFHIVYYQWQGKVIIGPTLVCVSIHLECWLDKARAEIVTWAAVGVACQQQFGYTSVSKFWQCECEFNSHSNRIKCEKAFRLRKRDWKRVHVRTINSSTPCLNGNEHIHYAHSISASITHVNWRYGNWLTSMQADSSD